MSQTNTFVDKTDWAAIDEKNCHKLKGIFHMSLLMGILPYMNTREKMMDMLNKRGDPRWTACYICELATDNKIKWVQGSSDPTPYKTYQSEMNDRLAEILKWIKLGTY